MNLVAPGQTATGLGPIIKLAGDLYARALSISSPISPQSLVTADNMEDEATFLPLVVERFEQQIEIVQRLTAIEALLSAQAMDIVGDKPKGVIKLIYDIVRTQADFYTKDRPLSDELEHIQMKLASNTTLSKLVKMEPIESYDRFFAINVDTGG